MFKIVRKMKLIVFCLGVSVLHIANAAVTLCPQQNQTDYMNSELSGQCANALTRLRYRLLPQLDLTTPTRDPSEFIEVSSTDLDIACQNSCGGNYSAWLREDCQDPYTARCIDAMCASTFDTTDEIGPRCRYGFPDAFDGRAIFLRLFSQYAVSVHRMCAILMLMVTHVLEMLKEPPVLLLVKELTAPQATFVVHWRTFLTHLAAAITRSIITPNLLTTSLLWDCSILQP